MKWAWVFVGTAAFSACVTIAAVVVGSLVAPGDFRYEPMCQSNLKQLALASMMYSQDYDNRLPLQRNWSDGIFPYVKNRGVYICPKIAEHHQSPIAALTGTREYPAPVSGPPSYAYNSLLSGMPNGRITRKDAVPMLYDSIALRWNAADPAWSFAPRHKDGSNVAYADGHVKWSQDLHPGASSPGGSR